MLYDVQEDYNSIGVLPFPSPGSLMWVYKISEAKVADGTRLNHSSSYSSSG